ncbi:hypothetical protein TARUN_3899 [Trichoderma arundinaceum]|uniref:Uncharacterized protein n=1 Tax=Trichoderma arundinaceum TaxID=490622 RepID=A0A395NRC2_TRIAR|nr:hypothetical protein TARUN_3899 [Trichoderma arundinaceum]
MRTQFFIYCAFLVPAVWAGGYQGALERVWDFYAYQIDGLNDAKDRILGFSCKKWDSATKKCAINPETKVDEWEECQGKILPSKRCTFNELMGFLGKFRGNEELVRGTDGAGNPLPQDTETPDIKETGKYVYSQLLVKSKKVGNVPPYKFMYKATGDYVAYLSRMENMVTTTGPKKNDLNKHLFDGFKAASDAIKEARIGDHGPFLIAEAEKVLKPKGFTIEKMPVGTGSNPVTGAPWETVDWEKTVSTALEGDRWELDVLNDISDFHDNFYKGGSAKDHKVVMESFKIIGDKLESC